MTPEGAGKPLIGEYPGWVVESLRVHRVARLGTRAEDGSVRLVPVCFALVGEALVSAVDHKPKRTGQLRRLDDMRTTGTATLLLDHYEEDWSRLWWIRVTGRAAVFEPDTPEALEAVTALSAKYVQYATHPPRGSVWSVGLDVVRWWRGG